MGYMMVEEHSATLLHLKRSPGLRSWSLLVGIASVGLAAAYYSSDSMLWKLFYVTGCLFVAMQNMEEWEEAVFDKTKNLIELKTFSLYALVLTLWRKGHEKRGEGQISGEGIPADAEAGCRVLLPPHPDDVEALAALLKRFLGLEELQQRREKEEMTQYAEEEDSLDNSSDSEEEAEQL
ncbi:hypothetical protein JOQ06_022422 [Pogonophryne albipinna]|uniref:Essential for reactive oxygen species protein n=1 Tax=Pogonophryne albipinna TaxID=1090488 RepID=A0AAD6ABB0_9TELE|nr:hypothetical protein JOQ06_022422 [Pogonophryne albipinna]